MIKKKFVSSMSKREAIMLLLYTPIHTILLPILMGLHSDMYEGMFTGTQYNIAYIIFSFVVTFAIALRFLRAEFDGLLDHKWLCFVTYIRSYLLSFVLGYIVLVILMAMIGDISTWSNPNDMAVQDMASEDFYSVICMAVFLGPIVEETMFRGLIFGKLRERNRLLAYVVSVALFAILHVWQYALVLDNTTLFVYVLDYIPTGIVLAWCYEKSGTIWLPIFYHMGSNMMALSLINYI